MKKPAVIADDMRETILMRPEVILEDRDLMKALIAANERTMGVNVVDLRGIAMERLEARLERLEDTHRSVIAAAYDNLAGTNQIHRAVLKLLEPLSFEDFLVSLGTEVASILRVETIRLVLETHQTEDDPALRRVGEVLCVAEPGFVASYVGETRERPVILRQTVPEAEGIHGEQAAWVRSEALMPLDLGEGRLAGLLVIGSEDPHQFRAQQGTDLLGFFAGSFERMMRRWLA